jgi:hypothetical protein
MAGPQSQNPKGRRLILVLLKQGLMLLPLSLKILGKKNGQLQNINLGMKSVVKTRPFKP